MNNSTDPVDLPPPRKRQITIRAILFATTLVAIAAAGFGGLVRTDEDDLPVAFIVFVIAAPLALMLVLSVARGIERFVTMRRKRRKSGSDS
jgi:hypothetical protein